MSSDIKMSTDTEVLDLPKEEGSLNPSAPSSQPRGSQPRVNFPRPQPGQPSAPINKQAIQRQMRHILQHVRRFLPDSFKGELWMYAAAYVSLYTLLMLFRMSTFGFICVVIYTVLITMLVLRFFGHGPLVDQNSSRLR